MPHYVFEGNTYKYMSIGVNTSSWYMSLQLLWPRKQVRLHLCWRIYIKRLVGLNAKKYFNVIMILSLKTMWQTSLKNTMLTFEKQLQNISTLWRPLAKSWENSCLSLWMLKSFKTLKNYFQFELKSRWHCKQDQKHKIIDDWQEVKGCS